MQAGVEHDDGEGEHVAGVRVSEYVGIQLAVPTQYYRIQFFGFSWPVLWSRSILARLRLQLVKMAAPALAL